MNLSKAALAGCAIAALTSSVAQAELVYGVTLQQTLVTWDHATPGTLNSGVPLWGMAANETIMGIDFRPATGELYALGTFSRFYKVNPITGQAMQQGPDFNVALNGSSFGFDFNPTVDRIRMVSDADQNLRGHPITAAITNDGTLNYVASDSGFGVNPNIVAGAYTNNKAGATSTTLYVLDSGRDVLCIQNPANSGNLVTVGLMGTDVTDMSGFDISGLTGTAYAVIRDDALAKSTFWTINLATGQGTMIGEVGGGAIITAMSVPGPGAAGLAGLGVLAMCRRRR